MNRASHPPTGRSVGGSGSGHAQDPAGVDGAGEGVQVRGLGVLVGRGRRRRRAVDDLDLDLGVGVHGLLGPNGAGKTTLMRVLATVVPATSGQVRMLGLDVADPRARRALRRRLGYLPQAFGYYPRFTVEEFVTYFAWLKEVPGPGSGTAVARAIERVGLADRAQDRMKTLSGGMLRRAGLAQALVNDPDVLLLDEPTAGLDPEQRLDFRALLRELGVDTTVVVSTHLVEDVASACTRVGVMDTGRLVRSCTPTELASLAADEDSVEGDSRDGRGRGHQDASPIELGYTALLRAHRAQTPGAVGPDTGEPRR